MQPLKKELSNEELMQYAETGKLLERTKHKIMQQLPQQVM
jgi:hypothetical protein